MSSAEQLAEKYVGFPVAPPKPVIKVERRVLARYAIAIALVLALTGMFYTYEKTMAVVLGYQVSSARRSVLELQRNNKLLEYKIAELQSPGRVERIARSKLGMTEPETVLPENEIFNKGK